MILLVTPPFTQLNTAYPATAYLKGFLNTQSIPSYQVDLGLEVILAIFCSEKLKEIFDSVTLEEVDDESISTFLLKEKYIQTIDAVMAFLQNQNPTLAYQIATRNYLPEGNRFHQLDDIDWAFGHIGVQDKARHLATLYLEDLGDFINKNIDLHFGFSRYAESLSVAAHSFDPLAAELTLPLSIIEQVTIDILQQKIEQYNPTLIAFSIPFPGNLFAALRCGQMIKSTFPHIKIAWGGGYPNTELRSLTDIRVFDYTDFICLDDGEATILALWQHITNQTPIQLLKRTLVREEGKVVYHNLSLLQDVRQELVGTPDYSDLRTDDYLSIIEIANPMHRLWNDGRWNKMTLAHGCYWGKCSFCDISLDYIKNYEFTTATLLVDRMQSIIAQTGHTGFHFVDEAAPPALMKAVALEIIRRQMTITWWTNIRFEKNFTQDLCTLLAASGCIAVSGGLEVASDRLLALMNKGVTVKQVAQVTNNFTQAGIMVHAYLMYGFPTQTAQETIDSLEMVRQLFEAKVIQSGFWHLFSMTAHSPVGMQPDAYQVSNTLEQAGAFAHNDLPHIDKTGADHTLFGEGLKVSLYNYMHDTGFDLPLHRWFSFPVPKTTVPKSYIAQAIMSSFDEPRDHQRFVWIGCYMIEQANCILVGNAKESTEIMCQDPLKGFLTSLIVSSDIHSMETFPTYASVRAQYINTVDEDWHLFWLGLEVSSLRNIGLLLL